MGSHARINYSCFRSGHCFGCLLIGWVRRVSGDTLGGVGNIPGNGFSDGGLATDLVNTIDYPEVDGPVLAEKINGNRIIIIGDSILAGTASRYGGAMCSKLVPMGWRVAVEAETGQSINFGRKVLKARIYDGWDAAVIFWEQMSEVGSQIFGQT